MILEICYSTDMMQEYTSKVLGAMLLFVSLLALFFLLMIPLSLIWSSTLLAIGWFLGPLLLCFVPLLAALFIQNKRGARWEKPRSFSK